MLRLTPVLIAGMCAFAPAPAQQVSMPALQQGETLLQVAASGSARAVPDLATISASVTSDAPDPRAALQANNVAAARLIAALRGVGVEEGAIRTSDLRVSPRFRQNKDGDDTDQVIGSRAVNRVTIRLVHVTEAGRVIEELSQSGATQVSGPEFGFQDDSSLKRQARAAAVHHAQDQAADYAAAFNLRPARILRISERSARADVGGDIVVTGTRSKGVVPPVLPGEQELSVEVWVDYALTR